MPSLATARALSYCTSLAVEIERAAGQRSPHGLPAKCRRLCPRFGRAQPLPAALSDRAMELNDLIEAFFVIAFLASAILLALGLWRRRK